MPSPDDYHPTMIRSIRREAFIDTDPGVLTAGVIAVERVGEGKPCSA